MSAPRVGAVELGGTKIVCAIGSGPGDIVAEARIATTAPGENLAAIVAFLRAHGPLDAVGIASFGPVCLDEDDPRWGHITATTKPGWSNTPVAPVIADALGVPVAFDTDVNGAALGEHRQGALAGCRTGLYVTIGTGVGGGLILDGRPHHGRAHPEMGHIRVRRADGDGFAGTCPFHGDCFEGLASGPAIAARLGCNLAEAVDDPARHHVIAAIGQGLASLVLALSPERIVVGGGVAKAPGFHGDVSAALVAALGGYGDIPGDFVVPPLLGDRSGIAGAMALARDRLAGR